MAFIMGEVRVINRTDPEIDVTMDDTMTITRPVGSNCHAKRPAFIVKYTAYSFIDACLLRVRGLLQQALVP